jgi:large subunit ribosomal protein L29
MSEASKLRDLSLDELAKKEADLRQEMFNLRFQHATHQLEDTARISKVRRSIARILTLIKEKAGE